MRTIISTRGFTISKSYKDAVTRKLAKLEPLLPKVVEAKVVLSKEKHRRTAGVTLVAKHRTLHSEETAPELAVAVDLAMDVLSRQVRTVKERVKEKKVRRPPARSRVSRAETEAPAGDGAGAPGPNLVVREVTPKPMSVEEAMEQFHLGREQFLVFTNAHTDAVNVLYRRQDGGLGLIEPVA
jgi:putative sigma-54 modulation protein